MHISNDNQLLNYLKPFLIFYNIIFEYDSHLLLD